jgi:hypothetical protein
MTFALFSGLRPVALAGLAVLASRSPSFAQPTPLVVATPLLQKLNAPAFKALVESKTFTLEVPVSLSQIDAHHPNVSSGPATVDCTIVSGASYVQVIDNGMPHIVSGPESTGGPGIVVGSGSAPIPLDATRSYAGPPIAVTIDAASSANAGRAHTYVCYVLFNHAPVINPRLSNSTYLYVPSSFKPLVYGDIK